MNTIERTPPQLIKAFINETARIAVGFSGGADSLALLVGLCAVHDPANVYAFYVNHRLRNTEELAEEIALNQQNAHALGVHFEVLDLGEGTVKSLAAERKKGIEEAARLLRYEALIERCTTHRCSMLLTGHNADDQMETILRRILTASSFSSLQGIRITRDVDGVRIVRPLLSLTHEELQTYLTDQGWQWSEDSTNENGSYQRNQLRKHVTGELLELFPGAHRALELFTERFSKLDLLIESLVDAAVKEITGNEDGASFSLSWFQSLDPYLQELILFRLSGDDTSSNFIAQISENILTSDEESSRIFESRGHHITVDNGVVQWKTNEEEWSYAIRVTKNRIELPKNLVFTIEKESTDSTLLRINSTLLVDPVLRLSRPGDEFEGEGGRSTVAKILRSQNLQPALRVPLLVDRSGIVAIFARAWGGRDRLALRFKAPLARPLTNIYSVNRRIDNEVYE